MTAGRSFLSSIIWSRSRSDSGSSTEMKQKISRVREKGSTLTAISNILNSSLDLYKSQGEQKVVKFSWRVKDFIEKITNCGDAGINSKNIKIKINDVTTTWNASLRFWTSEKGEKVLNPFLFCCNLVSVSGDPGEAAHVGVSFDLNVLHPSSGKHVLSHLDTDVHLVLCDQLRCVAATNATLDQDHVQPNGDVVFQIRLSFSSHSNKMQEKYLTNHPGSTDLIVVCGTRHFPAHKQILAKASVVFDSMIVRDTDDEVDDNNNSFYRDRLVVEDLNEGTLEKILHYIYNGSIEFDQDCLKILLAANKYQLTSLKNVCEKTLAGQLSPSVVSEYLLIAHLTNCQNLKLSALKYCKLYKEYIFKDETWNKIEEERPDLYDEALLLVAPTSCRGSDHVECVRRSNRYRDLVTRYGDESTNITAPAPATVTTQFFL